MKKFLALLLIATIFFCLAGCQATDTPAEQETTASNAEYEEKGTGNNSFYLDVAFEKDEKHFLIKTNKTTVGDALIELKMIEGEQGKWGVYISSVCGENHKYETDGSYWAFYAGGQYASKSVELTDIENGHIYALKVEKGS